MEHYFEDIIAQKYGIKSAVIYEYIKMRCERKYYIIDGRSWTRISLSKFKEVFPYLSEYEICQGIDTLADGGAIEIDYFNKSKLDRTRWFAIAGA